MLWVTPLLCCKPYLEKPPSNVFCCWSRRKKSCYSSHRQNYQKSGTLWTGITCKIVVYSHDVHFITRSHPATADTYLMPYIGNEWMNEGVLLFSPHPWLDPGAKCLIWNCWWRLSSPLLRCSETTLVGRGSDCTENHSQLLAHPSSWSSSAHVAL